MTDANCRANAKDASRLGDECLAEARYLLAGSFSNAAVSCADYAAFNWASALLMLKGLEPKTNRGVIQLLQLHYVEIGTLAPSAAAALSQLETYRELSDYNAKASFDERRATAEIRRAEDFIAACRPLVA